MVTNANNYPKNILNMPIQQPKPNPDKNIFEKSFIDFDINKDGYISKDEFLKDAFRDMDLGAKSKQEALEDLERRFNSIAGGDGKINPYEFDGKVEKTLNAAQRVFKKSRGAQVAQDLIGCTNSDEARRVAENIKKVKTEDVLLFLKGYRENSLGGNYFFEQMRNESPKFDKAYDGGEFGSLVRTGIIKNIANKLAQYLESHGEKTLANDVKSLVWQKDFSRDIGVHICQKLDDIANLALELFKDKKAPETPESRGVQVAKDLIGFTNYKEAQRVRNNLEKISTDDIMKFLSSYNENSLGGNYFFKQMITEDFEYGFGDSSAEYGREKLIKMTAAKVEQYLRNNGESTCADMVNEIRSGNIDEKSCQKLDEIVNKLIEK